MDAPEKGRRIAVFSATIVLYDPDASDVSRAGTPIEPDEPTVKEIEEEIERSVGELGYGVNATLTRTDK